MQWIVNKTDVDMRRRIEACTAGKKTTGESSTDKKQCDQCGRWFLNLSNHRKCSGQLRSTSHADVLDASQPDNNSTYRRTSQSGITRKYALKQKVLQPKEKILQVCDILVTVIKIHS